MALVSRQGGTQCRTSISVLAPYPACGWLPAATGPAPHWKHHPLKPVPRCAPVPSSTPSGSRHRRRSDKSRFENARALLTCIPHRTGNTCRRARAIAQHNGLPGTRARADGSSFSASRPDLYHASAGVAPPRARQRPRAARACTFS
jgi:hypothetical protein